MITNLGKAVKLNQNLVSFLQSSSSFHSMQRKHSWQYLFLWLLLIDWYAFDKAFFKVNFFIHNERRLTESILESFLFKNPFLKLYCPYKKNEFFHFYFFALCIHLIFYLWFKMEKQHRFFQHSVLIFFLLKIYENHFVRNSIFYILTRFIHFKKSLALSHFVLYFFI